MRLSLEQSTKVFKRMPSRERSIRTEAVVLRHSDWGEADRLLWLYSRELGKVRAIGKGLRKPRSRKAGHLEPFTRVVLQMARGRDLWIVTQVDTIDAYLPVKEELFRMSYASYVVELLDKFTYEEGENPSLYRLLTDTLARLSRESDPFLSLRYYEVRLLDLLGFRPQLFQCSVCGKEITAQDQYFSASQGGAVCPICGVRTTGTLPIKMESLKYLRHFQRSSYSEAGRARPSPEVKHELENLVQHYLTYLLERGLNSPAFLRRLISEQRDSYQNQEK
jgi:DNA repair protein RecO (recombination protein O)